MTTIIWGGHGGGPGFHSFGSIVHSWWFKFTYNQGGKEGVEQGGGQTRVKHEQPCGDHCVGHVTQQVTDCQQQRRQRQPPAALQRGRSGNKAGSYSIIEHLPERLVIAGGYKMLDRGTTYQPK